MTLREEVPGAWRQPLAAALASPWFEQLVEFVDAERARGPVYPPAGEVFTALRLTPPDAVRVVLLGQDPYHGPGQAQGLAFSVRDGVGKPPSLVNMFKELHDDVGCPPPKSGSLAPWAQRGVLLLNTVLTVRQGEAFSHKGRGWETFTDDVLRTVSRGDVPVVFLLWGSHAQKKRKLIDEQRHTVVTGVHPSPLSAHKGFFGSKPYSVVNGQLVRKGRDPIDWCLPA